MKVQNEKYEIGKCRIFGIALKKMLLIIALLMPTTQVHCKVKYLGSLRKIISYMYFPSFLQRMCFQQGSAKAMVGQRGFLETCNQYALWLQGPETSFLVVKNYLCLVGKRNNYRVFSQL